MMTRKNFVRHDGGRALDMGTKAPGDCVARAVALTARLPYAQVHRDMLEYIKNARVANRQHPSTGVATSDRWFSDLMRHYGFVRGHAPVGRLGDMPVTGRHLVQMLHHATSVIDGQVVDTWDPHKWDGGRVRGYWTHDRSRSGGLSV